MKNYPVLDDEDGNDLPPEQVIANIDAWLKVPGNELDRDADFLRRQRDWAARCIREGRRFRFVPEAVAVVVSAAPSGHLKGCKMVPAEELLRNIEEWKLVWPDAPQEQKDRYEKIAAEARERLVHVP
jgi:hypothetical protein